VGKCHKSFSRLSQFGNLRSHRTHERVEPVAGLLMTWMMMAAAALAAFLSLPLAKAAAEPIELQWWHAMTAVNADRVNKIAADFNASQDAYKIVPVFKGSYAETMNAGVAAYRAGNAPHIIQIFEVGTATMMGAKGAVKPVYQLMAEAAEPFDPNAYLPAVTAYYSTTDGKMVSLPFNSSTAITYWNKDAFKKAGLDPDKAPSTWPDTLAATQKLRAGGVACGLTAGWISWTQIEQFSAWHNIPLATKANGLEGADALLELNNPILTKHIGNLAAAQKDIKGAPQNSIIGGASLWVMGGKKPEEYKGVAKFFTFLSQTGLQQELHEVTGYLPITKAAYAATKASGFYEKNPGREIPVIQMTAKPPTENSRGLRLGNLVQIRDIIAEDLESAFAGKQDAQSALDDAVKRGNGLLRQFERNTQQ
jgi:sn-glycerol 3-phosphate transport system substrate-binding protein